jgi:hypothetical protein
MGAKIIERSSVTQLQVQSASTLAIFFGAFCWVMIELRFLDEFFVAEEVYFELCNLITCHIRVTKDIRIPTFNMVGG